MLLLQSSWDDRLYQGLARHASPRNWIIEAGQLADHLLNGSEEGVDGVIVQRGAGPIHSFQSWVGRMRAPVVVLGNEDVPSGVSRVGIATEAVARCVFDHLSTKGFREICLVEREGTAFERQLAEAMVRIDGRGIHGCTIPLRRLTAFLKRRAAPLALVAASDFGAAEVIRICRESGYEVPRDCVVLGIGDRVAICTATDLGISSVDCAAVAQGTEAAVMLEGMLGGERASQNLVSIEPRGVTLRDSTDMIAIPHGPAAKTLVYLRSHFFLPMEADNLDRLLGPNPAAARIAFRKYVGRTILQELARLRVERAKKLLRNDSNSVDQVVRACGFEDRYQLDRIFSRVVGRTAASYRKSLDVERVS